MRMGSNRDSFIPGGNAKTFKLKDNWHFFLNKTKHSLSYDQATTILGSYKLI